MVPMSPNLPRNSKHIVVEGSWDRGICLFKMKGPASIVLLKGILHGKINVLKINRLILACKNGGARL